MTGNTVSANQLCRLTLKQLVLPCSVFLVLLTGCQQEGTEIALPLNNETPGAVMEFSQAAINAMGMAGTERIEFKASGWEACLGQPWNINEGWARWSLTEYTRVIDYATLQSYQTAQRQAGMDPDKLGGCGAQPDAAAQNQRTSVDAKSSFEQKLQVYLTPAGFLKLAQSHGGRVEQNAYGLKVVLENVEGRYRLEGSFGDDMLLDHIITWIDNTVFGVMTFEAEFADYTDFNGSQFPGHIVQKQGGYSTLDLVVSGLTPYSDAIAQPPESQGGRFGGGAQNADQPAYSQIGEGVYALHGAYQSVIMEFDEYSVVLDGLQNDSRVDEIIRLTKELIPDKPIGYVLVTHNHFDHASGLRQFVAEGARIITHDTNVDFFRLALDLPRMNPEMINNTEPAIVVGVSDFSALDDGSQRVEFHKLNGSLHADDMLVAYIPAIKTIVEADLLQPWINPVFGGGDHPYLIYLADELDRLALDYEQFVPIHRPSTPPTMSRADLLEAVGRN